LKLICFSRQISDADEIWETHLLKRPSVLSVDRWFLFKKSSHLPTKNIQNTFYLWSYMSCLTLEGIGCPSIIPYLFIFTPCTPLPHHAFQTISFQLTEFRINTVWKKSKTLRIITAMILLRWSSCDYDYAYVYIINKYTA